MSRKVFACIAGAVSLWLSYNALADHPSPLPDTVTTPNFGYNVRFTNNNPYTPPASAGDDRNYLPTTQAQNMANAFDNNNAPSTGNPAGYHPGYTGLGFQAPDFAGSPSDTLVFDCSPHGGCDSGNAPADRINMPAPGYIQSAESCIRLVLGHELFHHVQYSYITFGQWLAWGREAVEGTARVMQDKVYSDLDANGGCITYRGQVNNYLGNPNRDLWTLSYTTALFWNYMMEQFGTQTTEPQVGTDFVRRFWENAQANNASPDLVGTVRQTLTEFELGASLENVFHDFSIANYAKDLDVSLLADATKYRYVDENDGVSGSYDPVSATWSGAIPPTQGPTNSSVVRWGSRYFEADTQECNQREVMGFRAVGDRAAYSLIAVQTGDKAARVYKGVTDEFSKALIQRGGAEEYTRLVGVATGLDDPANFQYTFDCGPAKLTIKLPTSTNTAYAGLPDEPDTFLIRLLVTGPTSLGDPTVEGLDPSDFAVYVGTVDPANEAPVVSGANVQGEYWLVVQAPSKPATGTFDLVVKLGDSIMDSQSQSIVYEKLILDQVLVIDRSGSMGAPASAPKIVAAKNAAGLFVDAARSDDKIGVVSFNGNYVEPDDDATLDALLLDATDAHRNTAKLAIQGLSDGGLTSIGDGLNKGAAEFPIRGSVLGEDWLVLLSDGMQNEALFWSNIRAAIQAADIKVNSIALGPDTDQVLLQSIAADTGGTYYYVDVGTVAARLIAAPAAASSALPNQLADAYASAGEIIQRHERLWEVAGDLGSGDSIRYEIPVDEGGISEAIFSINWDDDTEALNVEVVRPDGSTVQDGVAGARIFKADSHVVVRVPTLNPGNWAVQLRATSGSPSYVGILSGRDRQGAKMRLYFAQFLDDGRAAAQGALFLRGLPQPILATLFDRKGPITGAEVLATVEHPDGKVLALPLLDDGSHGDGNANDGVYGNFYTRTTAFSRTGLPDKPGNGQRGSYNVRVQATGQDHAGGRFTRLKTGSFQVFELVEPNPDTDQDGMPDRYEALHACLDPNKDDAAGDPDGDDVRTFEEWLAGTDPCHPDTDRGGESDRSELGRDANPFDPRDDAIPRPVHVEVIDWVSDHLPFPEGVKLEPETNLIRFPVHPSYALMRILRSTSPQGPFAEVAALDPKSSGGLYQDRGLSDGITYYYQAQPVDSQGNLGTPSHVFSGTPNKDPVPSVGDILINGGQEQTDKLNATLTLSVDDPDVVEMMLANEPTFAGSPWQPYTPTAGWLLAPVPGPSVGLAAVYVKYRDAAGNQSAIYQDDIRVEPAGSLGIIEGTVVLDGLPTNEGAQISSPDHPSVLPDFSQPTGFFQLMALTPDLYELLVTREGYQRAEIGPVKAVAGTATNVGTIRLTPIDTDSDGVPDVQDNCIRHPNGPLIPDAGGKSQLDTDKDGYGNLCDPDFNGNAVVDPFDFSLLKSRFGQSGFPDQDLNGNGVVDPFDFSQLKAFFGQPPGPSCCAP